MADTDMTSAPVDAQAPATVSEPPEQPETNGQAPIAQADEDAAGKVATTEVNAPDGAATTEAAEGPSGPAADGTPASSGKDKKRKSISGVPEHKTKKLNKKKSMPDLHLDCKPGELYWARLKGYPPWPAVICDEQMLPETLLASRPVSTARPDGSLRDDYKEGGKNAKERTFPIMFLSTNEFAWLVNTGLTKLDPEEAETKPTSKITKALHSAYELAATNPSLDHFKRILKQFQDETAAFEAEQRELMAQEAEKEAGKKTKEEKKKSRKSKGGDDDVEMDDAEAPKSSKKRKKEADSDGDGAKSKKTPKITKLNAPKSPNGEVSAKKTSSSKPKKKISAPKAEDQELDGQKEELSEAEKMAHREKTILYLRHRLQKGFLTRDHAPREEEMAGMDDYFTQLERHQDLDAAMIRTTKIHKVLKAIVKLASVPKDEEFGFKRRSHAMLEIWNKRMEADGESAPKPATEAPTTNGADKGDDATAAQTKEGADKIEEEGAKMADEIEKKVEETDTKAEEPEESAEAPAEPASVTA